MFINLNYKPNSDKQYKTTKLIMERLAIFKTKSFDELSNLDECQSEEVIVNEKKNSLAVWKDQIGIDKVQIVVQVYNYFYLGFGIMNAESFTVDSSGRITDLKREELWDFQ